MAEYLIKNGFVFDPTQKIKGDVADVAIRDGKIVKSVEKPKVIDAKGMTVMAGALEIHAHVAGPKVNIGRITGQRTSSSPSGRPKGATTWRAGSPSPPRTRPGTPMPGSGTPRSWKRRCRPLFARHVHEEMRDTPIIDEGAYPVFGNNWFVLEYIKNKELENTAAYIAWLLKVTKGFRGEDREPGRDRGMGLGAELPPGEGLRSLLRCDPRGDRDGAHGCKRAPGTSALDPCPREQPREPGELHDDARYPQARGGPQGQEQVRPRAR